MSDDNDCSGSESGEFLKGKKKAIKKITKLGKRPYNKGKNNPIKYQNKGKRDYNFEKSTNYSKLAKEKFLYLPYHPLPDLSDYIGEIIEVRIASEYLSHNNKAFMEKRIWGSDIYTSDSDVVCILQHSGYFEIKELSPTNIQGVSVFFRVSKSRSTYNSTLKNGIKSRKLNNYQGHSIKPEKYTLLVEKFGSQTELLEMASRMPKISLYERHKPQSKKLLDYQSFREFNISFNFSNELWWAYSLPAIADKGYDFKDYLSWKLKDKVLYIENNQKRYEISRNIFDHLNDDYLFDEFETFRFSEVLEPFEKDGFFMLENYVPLEANLHVKVLYDRLDWHELHWGENSLKVKNELLIEKIKAFNFCAMSESKRNSSVGMNGNNMSSGDANACGNNDRFIGSGNGAIFNNQNGGNTLNQENIR